VITKKKNVPGKRQKGNQTRGDWTDALHVACRKPKGKDPTPQKPKRQTREGHHHGARQTRKEGGGKGRKYKNTLLVAVSELET